MAKNTQIIPVQSMIIIWLHLVISKTKFLPLVVEPQATIKSNYLISVQINGRQKLHFLSAHLSEFTIWFHFGFHVFSIHHYGVVSRQSSVLIIGGNCDGSSSSLIAEYTIDKWERVGNLQDVRRGHRAIANNDRIYVVGGPGTLYVFLWFISHKS